MSHEAPPPAASTAQPAAPATSAPPMQVRSHGGLRYIHSAMSRALHALLRAEKRITANFRVPPHGG